VRFYETFGDFAFTMKARMEYLRTLGPSMSPFNAFTFLQGLETLHLRMERHCENAMAVAKYLDTHKQVKWVEYGGLKTNQYHKLAKKYCKGTPSALLSFGIKGGFKKAEKFYDALGLFKRLVNIGDAKSLACHPASTTHRQMSVKEQKTAGVTEDLLRLCVGIEHIDDIIADLEQAFKMANKRK